MCIRDRLDVTLKGLDELDTDYVLIIQDDMPFIRDVPLQTIVAIAANVSNGINYVRFNKRRNIKHGYDNTNCFDKQNLEVDGYSFTRTAGWSDNNHLVQHSYYKHHFSL